MSFCWLLIVVLCFLFFFFFFICCFFFFFQAEDGIRDRDVTGVQTCALPSGVYPASRSPRLLVRSYRTVSPLPRRGHARTSPFVTTVRRFAFCCTFPVLADGGCYPPSCPVEPGLSSRRYRPANTCSSADRSGRASCRERV